MTTTQTRIDKRFCGPPDSGNGGYVAGIVAGVLGGSGCVVTLHRPPLLDRPLDLRTTGEGAELLDGELVVASAKPEDLVLNVPAPPSLDEARAAEQHYTGHRRHNFPGCFVCGPERGEGDGLRIFPGAADSGVAASWTPGADLADEARAVRSEFLWAALDCPGYFAVEEAAGLALLGRMTAVIERAVAPGEPLVVTGWPIASDGRKHDVGTALHDSDGGLVAYARATWISPLRADPRIR
ncbi:hypothetical protein [Sphingomonas sp.]|uniref:hypothetical protein n=1 Tax=Sphingomonas sp. TaxID=28214 RepID=UPI00286D9EFC|nr:hypothetical protein [Sphingomonas sp.]